MDNKKIVEVLLKWGERTSLKFQKAIDDAVLHAGGQTSKLSGTIDYKVTGGKDGVNFKLTLADYWKYFDQGVDGIEQSHGSKFKFKSSGKIIPISSILQFVDAKSINVKYNKTGNKQQRQASVKSAKTSLAFAIAKSVKKKGIKPHPFYDKVRDECIRDLKAMMLPVLKEQYKIEVKNYVSNNK